MGYVELTMIGRSNRILRMKGTRLLPRQRLEHLLVVWVSQRRYQHW